jgi:hypothetical protein
MPAITLPFTFAPDTLADANQVNANFRAVAPGAALVLVGTEVTNPPLTVSPTPVFVGFAIIAQPQVTGRLIVTIQGNFQNTTAGQGAYVAVRYGTGPAPANGVLAPGVGTVLAPELSYIQIAGNIAGNWVPFTYTSVITGLAVGTNYWIDLTYHNGNSGNVSLMGCSYAVVEI